MRSRSLPGKSPRMGLSPHARGFLASAGSRQAGFLTVLPHLPYTRGSVFTFLPSRVRISTSNARRPTCSVHPRHDGPAR